MKYPLNIYTRHSSRAVVTIETVCFDRETNYTFNFPPYSIHALEYSVTQHNVCLGFLLLDAAGGPSETIDIFTPRTEPVAFFFWKGHIIKMRKFLNSLHVPRNESSQSLWIGGIMVYRYPHFEVAAAALS